MKIVITSCGESLDSGVDPRFGRAAKFILFDTKTGEHQVLNNEINKTAVQGAGIQAAQTVSDIGAQCVLTGDCGPKATAALEAANIRVIIGVTGTVAQAIEKFKAEEMSGN